MKLHTAIASLLFTAPLVAAVTERQCTLFEGPWDYTGSHPYIHVVSSSTQNTSLFISHIAELKDPFIEGIELDKRARVDEEVFSLCTTEAAGIAPNCTADIHQLFDTHKLTHRVLKFGIESSILSDQDTVSYKVEAAGVYCVLLHQDGNDGVEDIAITQEHVYGSSSTPGSIYLKSLIVIALCLAIQLGPLGRLVNGVTATHGLVVGPWNLYGSVIASRILYENCLMFAHWAYSLNPVTKLTLNPPSLVWLDPLMILDQLVSVVFAATVCQALTIIHTLTYPYNPPHRISRLLIYLLYRCFRAISHFSEITLFFVQSGPLVCFLRDLRSTQMAVIILTWNTLREPALGFEEVHCIDEATWYDLQGWHILQDCLFWLGVVFHLLLMATLTWGFTFITLLFRPSWFTEDGSPLGAYACSTIECLSQAPYIGLIHDTRITHLNLVFIDLVTGYLWDFVSRVFSFW